MLARVRIDFSRSERVGGLGDSMYLRYEVCRQKYDHVMEMVNKVRKNESGTHPFCQLETHSCVGI
jgi:hypothetical protein